jgi:hypothetical protein
MSHITTKYIRATRSNVSVTEVYIDGNIVGKYRRTPKTHVSQKYMACTTTGVNANMGTVDEAIDFIVLNAVTTPLKPHS